MKFGLYPPQKIDPQGPHQQDERYVTISGSGRFVKNGEEKPFQPHDVIFVEAGAEHGFIDFTEGFPLGSCVGDRKAARLQSAEPFAHMKMRNAGFHEFLTVALVAKSFVER